MPDVNGCPLPDDLYYDVDNQLWYREGEGGLVEVGITAVAAAMAGQVLAVTPKRAARRLEAGQACAVVESGKVVGSARVAFAGLVERSNEPLMDRPALINKDPYGAGWLVVMRPDDWAAAKSRLIAGAEVAEPYRAKMQAEGFEGCAPIPSPLEGEGRGGGPSAPR
jgi:glycine cleavage system H protein